MVLKADKIKIRLTAKRTDRFALRVRRLGVAAIVSFRQFGQGPSPFLIIKTKDNSLGTGSFQLFQILEKVGAEKLPEGGL